MTDKLDQRGGALALQNGVQINRAGLLPQREGGGRKVEG